MLRNGSDFLYQIRWHGRGGQGAVTASKVFGMAITLFENHFAQSFPAFGVERRGAPVLSFTKIDTIPILDRSQVYTPDFVAVLDPGLIYTVDVSAGLKSGGFLVINAPDIPEKFLNTTNFKVVTVNASKIAVDILGRPIMNTAMVGAMCAVCDLVSFTSIENALREVFNEKLVEKNIQAARMAHDEALDKIKRF